MTVVLSLFPGIGLLDMAFELEGFCVVRGPDVLWGGDIRNFHPPARKFDGVIGGPPCQIHSQAGNLRSGHNRKAIDLIPEFERCIAESGPGWFVMENTPRTRLPVVSGYEVSDYLCNARWFGSEQLRRRRFSFGVRGHRVPLLIEPSMTRARRIVRCVTASDGKRNGRGCNLPDRMHTLSAQQMTFAEACQAQGLPGDFLSDGPFTKEGRWRMIGNGVPLPMGRAIARAVREAIESNGLERRHANGEAKA